MSNSSNTTSGIAPPSWTPASDVPPGAGQDYYIAGIVLSIVFCLMLVALVLRRPAKKAWRERQDRGVATGAPIDAVASRAGTHYQRIPDSTSKATGRTLVQPPADQGYQAQDRQQAHPQPHSRSSAQRISKFLSSTFSSGLAAGGSASNSKTKLEFDEFQPQEGLTGDRSTIYPEPDSVYDSLARARAPGDATMSLKDSLPTSPSVSLVGLPSYELLGTDVLGQGEQPGFFSLDDNASSAGGSSNPFLDPSLASVAEDDSGGIPPPLPSVPPPSSSSLFSPNAAAPSIRVPVLNPSHLFADPRNAVGKGEYAVVLRGLYRSPERAAAGQPDLDVAIKLIKESPSMSDLDRVRIRIKAFQEAKLAANLRHPNIIGVVGVVEDPFMIVLEFASNGSLRGYLRTKRKQGAEVSITDKLSLLRDISRGMNYLCQNNVVHRDLAARNVLVDSDLSPRIADFGLSVVLEQGSNDHTTKSDTFPAKWLAPECLRFGRFSSASDVFSFAVLAWEVFANGSTPFGALPAMEAARRVLQGERVVFPDIVSQQLRDLFAACMSAEPLSRPSFADLEQLLAPNAYAISPTSTGPAIYDLLPDVTRQG